MEPDEISARSELRQLEKKRIELLEERVKNLEDKASRAGGALDAAARVVPWLALALTAFAVVWGALRK